MIVRKEILEQTLEQTLATEYVSHMRITYSSIFQESVNFAALKQQFHFEVPARELHLFFREIFFKTKNALFD